MPDTYPTVKVAAVHAAPVFLDLDRTLEKVERLVAEAAGEGAELVAFGEVFVSGYPIWAGVRPPIDTHDFHERLVRSGVTVPGPDTDRIAAIARRHGVVLSIGVNEVSAHSPGQVWNSNLVFDRRGTLVNHRRKLVATWYERLTWSHGDGADLRPVDLDGWHLGVLICGENTNTLAKYAQVAQGERLHVASFPPSWPFDGRDGATQYDLTDAIRLRTASHSFEGKVFSVVASTTMDQAALDEVAGHDDRARDLLSSVPTASMIIGPRGETLAGPLVEGEGILYADVDLSEAIVLKRAHDVAGTYNRFDVFDLRMNQRRLVPITVAGMDPTLEPRDTVTIGRDAEVGAGD